MFKKLRYIKWGALKVSYLNLYLLYSILLVVILKYDKNHIFGSIFKHYVQSNFHKGESLETVKAISM